MRWLVGAVGLVVGACSFRVEFGAHRDANPVDAPDGAPGDAAPIDGATVFTCATTSVTCAAAVSVVTSCNGKCWIACRELVPFATATARCTAAAARLAPLQSVEDQNCLHLTVLAGTAAWTGFQQALGEAFDDTGWSWNGDGQNVSYTNWSAGQPNDGDAFEDDTEQCAYKSTPSGLWQDTTCAGTMFAFACREP